MNKKEENIWQETKLEKIKKYLQENLKIVVVSEYSYGGEGCTFNIQLVLEDEIISQDMFDTLQ